MPFGDSIRDYETNYQSDQADVLQSYLDDSADDAVRQGRMAFKVADVDAVDQDGLDPGEQIFYTLSGTDENRFSIDNITGEVYFNDTPDYEMLVDTSQPTNYSFDVSAQEGYNTDWNFLPIGFDPTHADTSLGVGLLMTHKHLQLTSLT